MLDYSILKLVNIWLVLGAIGGYQLFLQMSRSRRQLYPEGFVRMLQYLTGIPALGSLFLFLVDPDELSFVYIHLPVAVHVFGLALFNIAAAVVLWSHIVLGRHWSGELETLAEHQLVHSGPYAFVRHPLYSSYLVLTVGFFLATTNCIVGALMMAYFVTIAARAEKEEEMLAARLGPVYSAYCSRTPRFVPFSPLR